MIRELRRSDAETCDAIISGLPGWFGDEQGIRDCAAAVRVQSGFVAEEDGAVAGFCTYQAVSAGVSEITWMAIDAPLRRTGIGAAILETLFARLKIDGIRLVLVKTLSDRDGPYREYDETRAFYGAMGFFRVAELDIWGPENPALLMARPL